MRWTLVMLALATRAFAQDWSVSLTELGDQKIGVIKIVREHTGLGLKEAKDLVEAPKPKVIKEGLTKSDADALVAELVTKGAKAEAHQKGARGPARERRAGRAEALFEIRLDETGPNKISVIKAVRSLTGLGLAEAKTVVESTPIVLKEGVEREVADTWASELISAGAKSHAHAQEALSAVRASLLLLRLRPVAHLDFGERCAPRPAVSSPLENARQGNRLQGAERAARSMFGWTAPR